MRQLFKLLTTKNAQKSAVFYFGSFGTSVGNYLFHLMLMRILAPAAYGEFLSYLSFLYLITIPAGTVTTVVSKYVADFYGQKDNVRINQFFYLLLQKVFLPSLVLAGLVMLFSPLLAEPLKAQKLAFIVLGINIVTSFLGAILNSYLMAFQQFIFLVVANGLQIIVKIGLAFLLIKSGFGATGGVIATLLAGLVSLAIVGWRLKSAIYPPLKKLKQLQVRLKTFFTYSFIFSAGNLSLISVDVLLVRYFFTPHDSGIYSALSVLGRMIYFGLTPFSVLLLPVVSKRFASQEKTQPVLWKLTGVAILFGGIGVAVFSTVPELVVRLLSGVQYLEGSQWLWMFALSMWLFALSRLLLSYLMAVSKEKANLILLLAIIIQPVLIGIWHANIGQVVMINLLIQGGLFACLSWYYKVAVRKIK